MTYAGKLRVGNEIYPGRHAGIVETKLWERANGAVDGWRKSTRIEQHKRIQTGAAARAVRGAVTARVPRISRLLALALKMEQMIQEGTVKNYTELARLGRVSVARITQVMNLLHLAPDIQEDILLRNRPNDWLRESTVRKLSSVVLWSEQRDCWRELLAAGTSISI